MIDGCVLDAKVSLLEEPIQVFQPMPARFDDTDMERLV